MKYRPYKSYRFIIINPEPKPERLLVFLSSIALLSLAEAWLLLS